MAGLSWATPLLVVALEYPSVTGALDPWLLLGNVMHPADTRAITRITSAGTHTIRLSIVNDESGE